MLDSTLKDMIDPVVAAINAARNNEGDNEARAYAVSQLVGTADPGGKASSAVAATTALVDFTGSEAGNAMIAGFIGPAGASAVAALAAGASTNCVAVQAAMSPPESE